MAVSGPGSQLRPQAERLQADLACLEEERLAFSPADMRGRQYVADLMAAAGMEVTVDAAFNVIGRLAPPGQQAETPATRALVVGSHLDTVPAPGRLDGALGVLAGIECVRALQEAGIALAHPLLVVAFSDEEGTATGGCFGSRSFTGTLTPQELAELANPASPLARRLQEAASAWAATEPRTRPKASGDVPAPRAAAAPGVAAPSVAAYLELHIEQGPVLERAGVPTAAVTSIAGIYRFLTRVRGTAGHAGTVLMADRDDALVKACALVQQLRQAVLRRGQEAVMNVGNVTVRPGSFNVIPAEVTMAVELRSPRVDVLQELEGELNALATAHDAEVTAVAKDLPVELDPGIRQVITATARQLDIKCLELPSWAGHDAAVLAPLAPAGMIFVPSRGGYSHCHREFTRVQDIQAGLNLLATTVLTLDRQGATHRTEAIT